MTALVRQIGASIPLTILAVLGLGLPALLVAVRALGLTFGGALSLYFVVWWITLFAVLPFGVRSQAETGDVVAGSEPGAPSVHGMAEKAIWTTLAADVVFLGAVIALPLAGL